MPSPRDSADLTRARAGSRRPLADAEIPDAEALGALVRALRVEAGYSQADLARGSELSANGLRNIEIATRRTRASTLARIAGVLSARLNASTEQLASELVRTAGAALAPETQYRERVEKRRKARTARNEKKRDQHTHFVELARSYRQHGPLPLRGPDGRFLPRQPSPHQLQEIKARLHRFGLAMPPVGEDGDFIEGHPLLDHSTARYWFNPPKRPPNKIAS